SILLVDRLPIRRSSVALLLERWAQTYQTPFRLVEPAKGDAEIPEPFDLALLSIGGTSAASPEVQAQITGFTSVAGSKPVAVLADDDDATDVIAAVRAGASGYISQRIEPDVMFRALKFIASGGVFFPPKALLSNADANADVRVSPLPRIDPAAAHLTNALTCRQSDVLQLLLRGQTNKCIARELRMRESTVKVHVRQIMRKLGASNRTQAALFARQADGAGLSMGHSTPA
ncbi:MAG: response regulator transcription factor, partial [Acetobacteraceae bacterium]